MKDPLVGPLAAIATGVLVARFVPFQSAELVWPMAAFAALAAVSLARRARALALVCGMLALWAAGALSYVRHAPGPRPELDVKGREAVTLAGCVVEPPAISGERERFLLEIEPHARAQVTLYTRDGEALPELHYGQKVEAGVRVRRPHNYGNPGAFDYEGWLGGQEIYWTASGAARELRVVGGQCGSKWEKAVMDLRQAALARIERQFADRYQSGMMQAILLGQSYQLQKVWTEEWRSTGTFHAIVISGTHIAVLTTFFLFCLRICFVPQSVAMLLTGLAAWLYALVTGWQTPCVRSAAGFTLFLAAAYFYRRKRPLNVLAAVAIVYLLASPQQLFDASFQLTFLAVGFLGAFAAPLIEATSGPLARGMSGLADVGRDLHADPRVAQFRIEMRLLARAIRVRPFGVATAARAVFFVYEVVAVSAVVHLGLALPMVVYFHRVGISGLSANAFIVPVMSVVVPAGFVAVFTGWHWLARAVGALLWTSQRVVAWHASIEPNWRIPTPPVWLCVTLGAAVIATAAARGRWKAAGASTAAIALALVFWHPFGPVVARGQLEITTVDVGQGDSILVVFPDSRRMIVDGGGIPSFGGGAGPQIDMGEEVVAPYLWGRSFRTVDVVALTHAHEDHIGGLPALVSDFRPRQLWTGATPEYPSWRRLQASARAVGTAVSPLRAGARFEFGGATVEALAPSEDYTPTSAPKNNDSLVLRITYGRHRFLLPGDAEKQIEGGLDPGRADVLKVGHHGSRTSSTEEFLDAVAPAFAVISAGVDNRYGHPNEDVLERLERHRAVVLRTDMDGLISVRSDGRRLTIHTQNGFCSAW